jgi:hypothetical protein
MTNESGVIEAKGAEIGAEVPAPAPAAPDTPQSNESQADLARARAIRAVRGDIRLRWRVIRQYERAERDALRDIARRGAAVIEPRCDSHGKPHPRLLPNPNIRVSREARAAIRGLQKEIAGLETQIADTAPPKQPTAFENLAARSKGLRKS